MGIVIAVAAYLVSSAINHQSITFFGAIDAAATGTFSSVVTFGIGSAVGAISSFVVRSSVQAVAHGLFQGAMYSIQGGKFWSGFAAGSISSLAASAWMGGDTPNGSTCHWNGLGGNWGNSAVGTMAFGAFSGGAGAALTGGNFWQGAVTGLIVSGFNHLMHQREEDFSDLGGDDTPLDGTEATVRNEINASLKLSRLYKNSGSYELQASKLEYGLNPDGTQSNTIVGKTLGMNPNDPNEGNLRSIFFQSAFRQGSKFLRITIAHELTHGYNKLNSIFLHNFNSYRKQGFSGDGAYTRAVRLDELYAYKIGSMFGGVTYYNQDPNPWHYNPTKMFK